MNKEIWLIEQSYQSNDSVWDRLTNWRTDRQRDRQTDGQTDRQTDGWTDGQSDLWTDSQTHERTDWRTNRRTDSSGKRTDRQSDIQIDRYNSWITRPVLFWPITNSIRFAGEQKRTVLELGNNNLNWKSFPHNCATRIPVCRDFQEWRSF